MLLPQHLGATLLALGDVDYGRYVKQDVHPISAMLYYWSIAHLCEATESEEIETTPFERRAWGVAPPSKSTESIADALGKPSACPWTKRVQPDLESHYLPFQICRFWMV